ncbi:pilus assembly protein [Bifidobacterium simiarum]|uniref:pilus assembly protein n=1 Tax=Bifidobacterium simiarum TaxID=2045441 RepID=UPI001FAEA987|nr:pilus assembly protein [Bifidobacterium simiarum]
MTDIWSLVCACAVIVFAYLRLRPVRWMPLLDRRTSCEELPVTLMLELIAVAVRQGSSIPRALQIIGAVSGTRLGDDMVHVASALNRGVEWNSAWSVVSPRGRQAENLEVLRNTLEPSWRHGVSPLLRIAAQVEQIDRDERQYIEREAAGLSVRLLMPMGLCFLPAFILIGVVPSIAAFAGG